MRRRRQKRPAATATPEAAESTSSPTTAFDPDAESGSYSTFYRKLEPYGDSTETGDYGYVFQPRQAAHSRDWRPYTNGRWVYTDAGWTWISDEQFGWATYHYGRWIRLRSVGWVWVPGEQWAPAWVSGARARYVGGTHCHRRRNSIARPAFAIGRQDYDIARSNTRLFRLANSAKR